MQQTNINYKNTNTHYGLIAKVLHWVSVFLLLSLIVVASEFEDLDDSPEKLALIMNHVSIGLIFLIVMLSRFYWRQANPNPIYSYSIRNWQKLAALSLHRLIYIIMFLQCLLGILVSLSGNSTIHIFELIRFPPLISNENLNTLTADFHALISILIYPIFAIHISAAIYHQIFGVQEDTH